MERVLRNTLVDGRFENISEVNSRRMAAVRSKGNRTTEKRLRAALIRRGIRGWVLHPKDLVGTPDFYFQDPQIAVFVDGCFWHGCPDCGHIPKQNQLYWNTKISRNQQRDLLKTWALEYLGIRVFRFWEHEIRNDLLNCVDTLRISVG